MIKGISYLSFENGLEGGHSIEAGCWIGRNY